MLVLPYDIIGIGFGPSNIALAIALEETNYQGRALFLECNPSSLWQRGMLLDGSDIQNNPLRDLITPVNPRSKYTFVNYLHQSGRFWRYLNLGTHYPLRKDFFHYVAWVAEQMRNVRYGIDIRQVDVELLNGVSVWRLLDSNGNEYFARQLVVGTGRKPNVPRIPGLELCDNIVHLTQYLPAVKKLPPGAKVAVLGASQSAVEIVLDLMGREVGSIVGIHRSFSYRLKDTSSFSDEVYFPEFIDYYHALPPEKRALLDEQVRPTNYSSADGDVISQLYLRMYEEEIDARNRVVIFRNHAIEKVARERDLVLNLRDIYTGSAERVHADLLVLATGFLDIGRNGRDGLPSLLAEVAPHFSWTGSYLDVERDYRVRFSSKSGPMPDLYLNGLCESSHGLGDAGSFSLVSFRARDILTSMVQRSHANGLEKVPVGPLAKTAAAGNHADHGVAEPPF
jgi:L-ornithine N5-oxygenase